MGKKPISNNHSSVRCAEGCDPNALICSRGLTMETCSRSLSFTNGMLGWPCHGTRSFHCKSYTSVHLNAETRGPHLASTRALDTDSTYGLSVLSLLEFNSWGERYLIWALLQRRRPSTHEQLLPLLLLVQTLWSTLSALCCFISIIQGDIESELICFPFKFTKTFNYL